ncbi:hypothetical protein DH2020_030808 [Rehmannia glutinosa]|uniref:CG-1 domain-containing protein n=1 Tax=Rehmannia glutinosa TaxID=99300 RepID=A0ABR0VN82_REHGL
MAESGSCNIGFRLDIKQILSEAQHRWLRPAEIGEILRNYQKFHIFPEAPNKPVLRYFRKDGHNWRKKKDGKTIKEAHEKLKVIMERIWRMKGNKTNISLVRSSDTVASNSGNNILLSSSFHGTSPNSTLSSAYEDAESGEIAYKQESGGSLPVHVNWQHSFEDRSLHSPAMNQNLILNLPRDHVSNLFEDKSLPRNQENFVEPFYTLPDEQKEQSEQRDLQMQLSDAETGNAMNPNMENFMSEIGNENYPFFMKKPLFSGLQKDESLKKVDSFSRWIAKELGESGELDLQSSNGISWSIMGSEYDSIMPATLQVDADTLNPSISQDQLFSIIDFSPNWAYADLETKTILSLGPIGSRVSSVGNDSEKQNILKEIVSLMEEENNHETKLASDKDTSVPKVIAEMLLEKQLKEKEDTVAALVYLGASPGLLTDPSAEYPWSRTPADLASSSGHKGISGFLAETSLTTHLSTLRVSDPQEGCISDDISGVKAIQTVSERLAFPTTGEDVPDTLCRAALCNATQAAANIHQIFRIQSFQRKQFIEHGDDELLFPDEHAIAVLAAKTSKGVANAAAVHIQKKFRGWKKRKEFLLIRKKVVKIQAHFRGHQVRKKTVARSVGILEKAILRWRRKRIGLRGIQPDAVLKGPNTEGTLSQEDDYDFLKEGRKQTEERMQKALARVKSMAQYPEARAQYRRLLTAAEGVRETKDASDVIPDSIEDVIYTKDDLIYIESLLDDDTFMSLAFE